ncbi:hypothetical protein C1H46_004932 [Malus baccata]|uniref:Uncharacterized protein n=1 Tax=Malus baccata TaxID=106549 RepID=A0A540NEH5_MALBA|nr:hypothetical protein C1H46_004932 [Malus baccata]
MDRSIEKEDKAGEEDPCDIEKGRLLRELPTRIRDGYIESKVSVEIGLMDLASLEANYEAVNFVHAQLLVAMLPFASLE